MIEDRGNRRIQLEKMQRFGAKTFSLFARQKILIIGDSYSTDLINMIYEVDLFPGADLIPIDVPMRCQIYIGEENWRDFVAQKDQGSWCKKTYSPDFYPSLAPLIDDADIIILASHWREWAVKRLPKTIENLHIPKTTKVIALGLKNFGSINPKKYLDMNKTEKIAIENEVSKTELELNAQMRNIFANSPVLFIDLQTIACGKDSEKCRIFTPNGKIITHDGGHLTISGAKYIGELLKNNEEFNNFLRDRPTD